MALKINGVRVAGIGSNGKEGAGVVAGGVTGQVLTKKTDTDYDTEWTSLPSTDPTLSIEGVAADAKAVGDAIANLDNYATKDYVDEAISSIDIPTGGGSAAWELINTIILEEDSNAVIIDKDSNGNSFDLSALMLYIDRVASDLQTENGTLYIGNAPNGYFTSMYSQTAAQTRLWVQVEFACPHGYKAAQGNGASSNYSFAVSYAGNSQTHAPMLRLYGYYFGAGTKITLYGVRK